MLKRRKSPKGKKENILFRAVFAKKPQLAKAGAAFVALGGLGIAATSQVVILTSLLGLWGVGIIVMGRLFDNKIRSMTVVKFKDKKTGQKSIFLRSKFFAEKVAKKQGGLAMKTKKGFIVIKGNRAIKVIKESMRPFKPPKIKRSDIKNIKFLR